MLGLSYLLDYVKNDPKEVKRKRVMERSLVLIKPGAVKRNLIGEIIGRYEKKGLKLVGMKYLVAPLKIAEIHYGEHKGRSFYPPLIAHITSGPLVAMCWEGRKAVSVIRKMNGATNPDDAKPGTIRGDLAVHIGRNVVHASDTVENGEREVAIWFKDEELINFEKLDFHLLYDAREVADEERKMNEEAEKKAAPPKKKKAAPKKKKRKVVKKKMKKKE